MPYHSEIQLIAMTEPRRGLYRYFPFPPAARAELWGGSVIVALSLLGALWVLKCRFEALALERDSEIVEGKVVRLRVTKDVKNRPHYWAEYDGPLELQAVIPRREVELPKDHFDRLTEGGPIPLRVCRTDPANHQFVGEHPRLFLSTGAMLSCLTVLALSALAGLMNLWWWCVSRNAAPIQVVVLALKSERAGRSGAG